MNDPENDVVDPDDARISKLLDAAADGRDVDWAEVVASAADPNERGLVQQLSTVGLLAKLLRALGDDPLATEPSIAADAANEATVVELDAWGPLSILAKLGSGTFGTVYQAWETGLEREVALKLLHKVPANAETIVVDEARLLARIRHPNVVTIFGADCFDGRIGFWMELVSGRTLSQLHRDHGRLSAQEAILLGVDLCRALAAVHQSGFLHCDVKAQNVIREAGGRIVLMDFGASVLLSVAGERQVQTRGTPLYLAPEVLRGAAPDVRSDLYSLGVLLYYLVSGEFPVPGNSMAELRDAHANRRRTLLRDVRSDLPTAFVRAIDHATAALPESRPESAGVMEALLESAAGRAVSGGGVVSARTGYPRSDRQRSIAVLPFVDIGSERNLAYFCDGVSEEILDALTKVPGLRVIARDSAFTFKNRTQDPRQVGSALNVGSVLEGSARASGGRLRVIARLIDTTDGSQLWSQRFDRQLDDVFAVQDEIAQAVASALGVRVSRARPASTSNAGSRDLEAYMMCLKGRYCWNQRTEAALLRAAAYFQSAVERDPTYAEAFSGLAEVQTTLGLYGVLSPHEIMPRAKASATRALALGGMLPVPYTVLGCLASVYEWAWHDAENHFRRAIELNPDHPDAHHWYAINHLVPLKRFGEASEALQRAAAADPLSMPIGVSVGLLSYFAHRFSQADRELREKLALDTGSSTARLFLGLTLVELARYDEAIRELETAFQLSRSPEMMAALAYAFARAGHDGRARQQLGELLKVSSERYVSPSLVAQVHAGLGETVPALEWLETARQVRASDLAWLSVRPVFDDLRSEPRFGAVVAALGQ